MGALERLIQRMVDGKKKEQTHEDEDSGVSGQTMTSSVSLLCIAARAYLPDSTGEFTDA